MNKSTKSAVSLLVALFLTAVLLTGCSTDAKPAASEVTATPVVTVEATQVPTATPTVAPTNTPMPTSTPTVAPTAQPTATPNAAASLTSPQRNSINMLNWLALLTQEINASSNNRMFIEEAYSLIVNETYPNAVDIHTQDRLRGIRDALTRYRMIDIKRERLEYIFDQNKAEAVRAAIPNPLTLMTAVQSASLARLATTIVYMAVDSYTSYSSATTQAEMKYLQDGWALDDAESEVFYSLRSDAFDYMIDIVREYDLPGSLALNEQAVNDFVKWKNEPNTTRRIQFFESKVETYRAFGGYWLVLAESYYQNGDYAKCLEAIHPYEELSTRIFRHDNEYAKVLPLAIASAAEVLPDAEYIPLVEKYAAAILDNCGNEDWALRYYAAQAYIGLYAKTEDTSYLHKAYGIVLDNVNGLVDTQTQQNETYLAKVVEAPIPAGTSNAKSTEIKNYNTMLRERRKTELPPIYEPLLLNCDLLFALSNQLGLSTADQVKVDNILHPNGKPLFLNAFLDNQYRFSGKTAVDLSSDDMISFNGKEITVPVWMVSDYSAITLTILSNTKTGTISDWTVSRVDRKTEGDVTSYRAVLKSPTADAYTYIPEMTLTIDIVPHTNYGDDKITFTYTTINAKPNWYDYVAVWNNDIGFQRVK